MNWIVTTVFFIGALASASATLCRSVDDCADGECCMGLDWLTMWHKGLCRPMARLNRPCSELESALTYFGGKFLKHCPCAEGLECAPKKDNLDKESNRFNYLKVLQCRKPDPTQPPKEVTTVSPDENRKTEATVTDRKPDEVTTVSQPREETTTQTEPKEETTPPTQPDEETTAQTETEIVTEIKTTIIEDIIVPETNPPEENVEGPGGEPPRDDDCEDWELPCSPKKEIGQGPGGEPPRDDDCEDWEKPCSPKKETARGPGGEPPRDDDCEDWELPCSPKKEIGRGPGGEPPRDDDCEDWEKPCSPKKETARGPGGEPPRDDDCEDWELPCSPKN